MASEEDLGIDSEDVEDSPEDPVATYVDKLSPEEQENEWQKRSSEILLLTDKEVNGELDHIALNDLEKRRAVAAELFRRLGKTNYIYAAMIGLDCVPEGVWEDMSRMQIGEENVRRRVDYFNEKRKKAEPPQTKPLLEPGA